jgi:uncharacterized protein (DUF58 family)
MWFRRIFPPDKAKPAGSRRSSGAIQAKWDALPVGVLRQLDRLQIRGSRELRGDRMGQRQSHRRKPSGEFIEHRNYVPGDDIRFVDWRTSARYEGVYIRQGELAKDVVVYILMDCSASMQWGQTPKSTLQRKLALIFGYLALSQGDQLYVHPYGGSGNVDFGPVSGKGQFSQLVRYLGGLNYGGESNLASGIRSLRKRITRGGILFVLSDLLERGSLGEVLNDIPAPLWWVNIVHLLHPEELDPSLHGSLELVDIETGARANYDLTPEAIKSYQQRVIQWQSSLELASAENHAFYSMIKTDASLEREVIPYLRSVKMLVAQ